MKYQADEDDTSAADESKPSTDDKFADEMLTIKLRYKEPDGEQSKEMLKAVKLGDYTENAPANLAFAACAAEFAMYLKGSEYSKVTPAEIIDTLESRKLITDNYRSEMYDLLNMINTDK